MKHYWIKSAFAALLLLGSSALYSLAEVRTCDLDNAIPKTSLHAFSSSAFESSGTMDTPLNKQKDISNIVSGVRGSFQLNPRLETALWISSNGPSSAIELHAKYLFYNTNDTHVSLVPCVYNSSGRRKADDYTQNTTLSGIGLPIILTWDTKRDLIVNLSAGINSDWISTELTIEPGYYPTIPDFHKSIWVPRAHVNLGFTAKTGILSLTPELGVTIVDAHDQGTLTFTNLGITVGVEK
jgi:hypothetical protein